MSNLFKYVLLSQMIGSFGAEIFALYIIQSQFYTTVVFSAISVMGQVFLYCFLGDLLVQIVCIFFPNLYWILLMFYKLIAQSFKKIYNIANMVIKLSKFVYQKSCQRSEIRYRIWLYFPLKIGKKEFLVGFFQTLLETIVWTMSQLT